MNRVERVPAQSPVLLDGIARATRLLVHPLVQRTMLGLGLVLLAGLLVSPWGQLLVRVDESWPHHRVFWLVRDPETYQRGDLVAYPLAPELVARLSPPEARARDYVRTNHWYLKRILGMPGDRVTVEPLADGRARIRINGQPVGETVGRDRLGNRIDAGPLAAVIPSGYYYVALDHPRSFDSRYYGYVPESLLEGRVVPLF